jgi:hypothetical protein
MNGNLGGPNHSQTNDPFAQTHDHPMLHPTNEANTEEKEAFYGLLEATLHQRRHPTL